MNDHAQKMCHQHKGEKSGYFLPDVSERFTSQVGRSTGEGVAPLGQEKTGYDKEEFRKDVTGLENGCAGTVVKVPYMIQCNGDAVYEFAKADKTVSMFHIITP